MTQEQHTTEGKEAMAVGAVPSAEEQRAFFLPRVTGAELRQLLVENPPLSRRCAACAYTEGTEAFCDQITARTRDDCDETGHPFWCHLHRDRNGFPLHLCRGWTDAATPQGEDAQQALSAGGGE